MKLSTRGRYGLMAMHRLALNYGKGPLSVNKIAEEEKLSVAYLEQLFARLKQEGLVKSLRGAQGGYLLAREPSQIPLGEIISVLEGEMAFSCSGSEEEMSCSKGKSCSTKQILDRIQSEVDEVLFSMSLAEML